MTRATIFEEHSAVLAHWFARGMRDTTLICLDAHLDLQFIDPERIARLAACATGEAVAALESAHCLSPDRSSCYGIEDFLYAAARLGLVRRVVWVAPPHVIQGGMAAALRGLLQMEGVTIDELESFQVAAGGTLEGRLLAVDMTICTLEQLPALSLHGPLALDIDADYFVEVPADTIWAEPRAVVAHLRKLAGPQADLTIARSVGSGFMPLRYRFLADHVAALWEGRAADADHWQDLLDLERAGSDAAGYGAHVARSPGCAASLHALALVTVDPPERNALLARAADLDGAYADDILRRLGGFRARRIGLDLGSVVALQREVAAAQMPSERQAIAWISLGRLYTAFGRLDEAIECDRQSRRHGPGHPELALEIAKLHMARGNVSNAIGLLELAASDDETRVGAWLHLAECLHATGEHARADEAGQLARRAAPAWPQVLHKLAIFASARGNAPQARTLRAEQERLEKRIAALATRMAGTGAQA